VNRLLFLVDEISTWIGKTAGWCILALTFTTSYEVFMRYLFLAPTDWAFDASYMLYGTLFMLAGAYTLSRNAHVRGDFIYRAWPPARAGKSGPGFFLLVFSPGIAAFLFRGIRIPKSVLIDERPLAPQSGRTAGLSLQGPDPDRRRADGDAGGGRSRPLHPMH